MENILDEASLRECQVFPWKTIQFLGGNFTSSEGCYWKAGLVSIMPKCNNKDLQVEFYKNDVLGSIQNLRTL